ncbi:serine/threonine-protein kinase DCLK1 isoform X6 [Nematostella vectensis]|uniref:serine/threonine-protein kinase DCLK1 isoform X6 n=1 Tax=Nematostella vectensis TaxID=45351 RepID=UPI001390305F|nr:serine/threonine-protein kinase DCLK1 isoform X6 [Nematostella vectensis]
MESSAEFDFKLWAAESNLKTGTIYVLQREGFDTKAALTLTRRQDVYTLDISRGQKRTLAKALAKLMENPEMSAMFLETAKSFESSDGESSSSGAETESAVQRESVIEEEDEDEENEEAQIGDGEEGGILDAPEKTVTAEQVTAASGDRMENGMMNGDEDFRSGSPGLQRSGSRNSIGRDGRNSLLRRNQSLSAKQIMFYRNGDRFFSGLKLAVSSERYKEFDSLLTELSAKIDLQTGAVRYIFNSETGNEVQDVTELQYGVSYVCSSSNHFQRIEGGYRNNQPQWALTSAKGNPKSELQNWQQNEQVDQQKDFIRAKLVTVVKHGKKPQKKVTMLLNKKTASSLNQVLDHLSSKVTVGKVDKLYTVDMKPIKTLRDLFYDDHTFVALSSHEKPPEEGFDLDLQQYSCKKNSAYRDLQRPSSGLKRSSSLRTTRQHRDSSSRDGGAPGRPVRRSSSVKSAGKGSRGRSVSPSRVNGHTPLSNRSKSPSSTGRKTPSGTGMGTDELYPAHVFEKDNMMSDSGGETKVFKKRRVSVHGFYRIGKVIGDGNFAVVRECKHRKTNKEYALKIINKAKVKGKEHMIENEISILRRVKHNHIVELIEEYETPREIFLVMELVKGGDLFEAIVEATKYTEVHASHMVRDLASALDYLHCNSIVHRDIKPENLLVLNLPNGRKSLKLADFGLAMEVKSPMFLVCGTPTYVAPEILDESGYGLKVDIWAAGVISYILLCGFPPFRSPDQDELFDLILAGEFEYLSPFWNDISSSAKDLIDHMLVVDANQRYSAKQVLAHPWVKGNTVAHKDIHVNLQNEINKNFDAKRRLRSAAVAVKTVKALEKLSKSLHRPKLSDEVFLSSSLDDLTMPAITEEPETSNNNDTVIRRDKPTSKPRPKSLNFEICLDDYEENMTDDEKCLRH